MPNPLLSLTTRPFGRRDAPLRRVRVAVPVPEDTTDAIFLMLRRMRGPLIALIIIFAITVLGLSLTPGIVVGGHTTHMTLFDAFYVMSYTATTIGFGELPRQFSVAQRLWMSFSIYLTVIGWAYSIGSVFSLVQDQPFRRAVTMQRFRRKVHNLHEPFYLIIGYGQAGRALAKSLDHAGFRLVIIDVDPSRIDIVTTDQLTSDVCALAADPRNPSVLGLAGLGHPHLAGVMSMTDEDDMNLAVVMAAHLFRPDVTVITRCRERVNLPRLKDFQPDAIINPFDRYGAYLVLALHHPATSRLTSWLLNEPGTEIPPPVQTHLTTGPWVVCADGVFGREVARDLRSAGLEVRLTDPADGMPDCSGVVGLVAGAESDTTNLSVAAAARLQNPDIYLSVRQKSMHTAPLVRSFAPESVFVATDIVASEALARVEAPMFWNFMEHVMGQDDDWSSTVMADLRRRIGHRTPSPAAIRIDDRTAPAVCRWLDHGRTLTLGQLLSDAEDRSVPLQIYVTELTRGDTTTFTPATDTPLQVGDQLALLVRSEGMALLRTNLTSVGAVEYLSTGHEVPTTWIGRAAARRRQGSLDDLDD